MNQYEVFELKRTLSFLHKHVLPSPKNFRYIDIPVPPTLIVSTIKKLIMELQPTYEVWQNKNRIQVQMTNDPTEKTSAVYIWIVPKDSYQDYFKMNEGKKAEFRFYGIFKDILAAREKEGKSWKSITFRGTGVSNSQLFIIKNPDSIEMTSEKNKLVAGKPTGIKADIIFHSGGTKIPISLKDPTGDQMGSGDVLWKEQGKKFLLWAMENDHTTIKENSQDSYSISPPIALEATQEEVNFAIFGTDIRRDGGCILKGNFEYKDFDFIDSTSSIDVECEGVYKSLSDFRGNERRCWNLIRNDSSHGTNAGGWYKGLRILLVQNSNIEKDKSVKRFYLTRRHEILNGHANGVSKKLLAKLGI